MTETSSLFTATGQRKYLNADERQRFLAAVQTLSARECLFCLTLYWSGARLSEVLALTKDQVLDQDGCLVFRSLKKRGQLHHRQVPVPEDLTKNLCRLSEPLFPWGRTWAWSIVHEAMRKASISGPQATPRGLRHSFAVHAVASGVPLHLVQRWLAHARLETTAIYTQVLGPEERSIAERMWG